MRIYVSKAVPKLDSYGFGESKKSLMMFILVQISESACEKFSLTLERRHRRRCGSIDSPAPIKNRNIPVIRSAADLVSSYCTQNEQTNV